MNGGGRVPHAAKMGDVGVEGAGVVCLVFGVIFLKATDTGMAEAALNIQLFDKAVDRVILIVIKKLVGLDDGPVFQSEDSLHVSRVNIGQILEGDGNGRSQPVFFQQGHNPAGRKCDGAEYVFREDGDGPVVVNHGFAFVKQIFQMAPDHIQYGGGGDISGMTYGQYLHRWSGIKGHDLTPLCNRGGINVRGVQKIADEIVAGVDLWAAVWVALIQYGGKTCGGYGQKIFVFLTERLIFFKDDQVRPEIAWRSEAHTMRLTLPGALVINVGDRLPRIFCTFIRQVL